MRGCIALQSTSVRNPTRCPFRFVRFAKALECARVLASLSHTATYYRNISRRWDIKSFALIRGPTIFCFCISDLFRHSSFVIVDRYGAVRLDLIVRFPRFPIILGLLVMTACVCVGQTPSGVETGIEGVITISPSQPGPIRADSPGSKPLTNTAFVVENQKGQVASFTTDDQGRFRIPLPPGHYRVSIKGKRPGIGRYGPFEVDVAPGKMTTAQWECDSGIR